MSARGWGILPSLRVFLPWGRSRIEVPIIHLLRGRDGVRIRDLPRTFAYRRHNAVGRAFTSVGPPLSGPPVATKKARANTPWQH